MPNLFLIDGVPGSGKSDLIAHCSEETSNSFLKKYTTKKKDKDGFTRDDLVYVTEEEFRQLKTNEDFVYRYPKYSTDIVRYLISKKELDAQLKSNKNVFVIVRSNETIKKIKKAYAAYLNVTLFPFSCIATTNNCV